MLPEIKVVICHMGSITSKPFYVGEQISNISARASPQSDQNSEFRNPKFKASSHLLFVLDLVGNPRFSRLRLIH